jgi:hypothetical protein
MIKLIVKANKWYDNLTDVKRAIFFFGVIMTLINTPYIIEIISPATLNDHQVVLVWAFGVFLITALRMVAVFYSWKEEYKKLNKN